MEKKRKKTKLPVSLLGALLIAAMLICATGCSETEKEQPQTNAPPADTGTASPADTGTASPETPDRDPSVIGVGDTVFTFTVVAGEDNSATYNIATNADTVGDALMGLGMISGEAGPYGLYVKTVCGIYADYDTTGTYWAFYVNGEYAMSGVDTTKVTEGYTYSFKIES